MEQAIIVSWQSAAMLVQSHFAYHKACYTGSSLPAQEIRELATEELAKKCRCSKCWGWIRPPFADRTMELNRAPYTRLPVTALEPGMIFLYLGRYWSSVVFVDDLEDRLYFMLRSMSDGDVEIAIIEKQESVLVSEIREEVK